MGLLDDAIREHLDLKRRRGADPTEVEREEREVLGPVRRRGEPAPAGELAHAPESDLEHEPLPDDGEEWRDWQEEPAAEAEQRPPAVFGHDQIAPLRPDPGGYEGPPPHAAPEPYVEPEPYGAPEPLGAPDPYGAPEPSRYAEAERELYAAPEPHVVPEPYVAPEPYVVPAPEPEPHRAETAHQPPPEEQTAEFNVERALEEEQPPHAPGDEEEDVLEETPEFLQDTPDHDRLWFEQRPPRDFDFDG